MTKEKLQIIEYNDGVEGERWSRFAAAMVFLSSILYFLTH